MPIEKEHSEIIPIPNGSLLIISAGNPNDDWDKYSIQGLFRALKDIDECSLIEDWLVLHPEQADDYMFSDDDFREWLIENGYIERVSCFEWRFTDTCMAGEMETLRL